MKNENTRNANPLEINIETVQDLFITSKLREQSGKFPTITKNPTITEKLPTASLRCAEEINPTITR
jgi:hypothetical protein